MQMIVASTTCISTVNIALSHILTYLTEWSLIYLVECGAGVQQQHSLFCRRERETFYCHTPVCRSGKPHAIIQLYAIIAGSGLLCALNQMNILACLVRHQRHIAATTATANSGKTVNTETRNLSYLIIVTGMLTRFAIRADLNLTVGHTGTRRHLPVVVCRTNLQIYIVKYILSRNPGCE